MRLRALREAGGLTQQRLADLLCMKPATVSLFESGDLSPTVSTLAAMAKTLRVQPADLLNFDCPLPTTDPGTAEEVELVADFRALPAEHKAIIRAMIGALNGQRLIP
jgi:transcriptional regulator with XRE-family HTH domain